PTKSNRSAVDSPRNSGVPTASDSPHPTFTRSPEHLTQLNRISGPGSHARFAGLSTVASVVSSVTMLRPPLTTCSALVGSGSPAATLQTPTIPPPPTPPTTWVTPIFSPSLSPTSKNPPFWVGGVGGSGRPPPDHTYNVAISLKTAASASNAFFTPLTIS